MGQKVHPLGFRVGITKKHQSQWFARFNKYKYSQSILEDRMIRETLSKLFPELLNPILNNAKGNTSKKRDEEISITPRITQIKIERGLIPYEIGIQIHAENCELLKSAIDNLKVKRELIVKLQKTRRYLLSLKLKLKDLTNNSSDKLSELNTDQAQSAITSQKSLKNQSSSPYALHADKKKAFTLPSVKGKLNRSETRNKVIPSIGRTGSNQNKLGRISGPASSFSLLSPKTKETGVKNPIGLDKKVGVKMSFKFRPKLTKQELRRQRLIKKRLKKRQFIRSRYRQLILKGLFIKKSGNKIIQTLLLSPKKLATRRLLLLPSYAGKAIGKGKPLSYAASIEGKRSVNSKEGLTLGAVATSAISKLKNTFSSRIKKKFVTLFIQKMNKKFLSHLKVLLMNYAPILGVQGTSMVYGSQLQDHAGASLNIIPLGYSKQWSLNRLSMLKNQPIYKLNRMIVVLEQKLLVKLESLRKEFIAFGSISSQSSESLGYFQILNFLKNLKELVNKLKREQKLQLSITKNSYWYLASTQPSTAQLVLPSAIEGLKTKGTVYSNGALRNTGSTLISNSLVAGSVPAWSMGGEANFSLTEGKVKEGQLKRSIEGDRAAETAPAWSTGGEDLSRTPKTTMQVLQKKLNNIEDECRKVKLIEYVKDIVKKHRTENIYFYLSTMADAGKDLRKIKQFTKRHADFLFGLNLKNLTSPLSVTATTQGGSADILQEKINERVSKVLEKASKKTNFEKTLQDIFLEQIEKQRTMCLENLQLTPKISIKFYAVNKKTLEQKASIVSESVVDALEKRKAFRKVIKDAKETLMRTPGVKGVKIQVAGRLNGAEIARTEWVRAGRVPLQTLRANLDYSYRTANTIYGIIGVRVWIFKGYAKLISTRPLV